MIEVFFCCKFVLGDYGSQNMCDYQPTLDTLELKEDKWTDYIVGWKSKGFKLLNISHYVLVSCIP